MRSALVLILLAALGPAASAQQAPAVEASAAQRMSKPGPEQQQLARQLGQWDVVAKLWPAPGAEPIVTRGLIAERRMIGPILQETMKPAPGSGVPDFERLDYLDFDRVEGRWKYVSMDTRFPVSIMPARSFGAASEGTILVQFEPQAFVGFGKDVEGRFMVSDMAIRQPDDDHVVKEQHVIMANGTGQRWRFVRYEYVRRR
ncbi:DUF1579 domain-containing protein [Luteimonas gilva]|uniref:DUF1579 domain-containing protein n=1 Tax=Luteimonas gilva TaxID=2572684 RepID=A0A4U5JJW2_9GAMM|nr:DUF1579 family protein [Luteimonas gilva]TKR29315.1 DUF1579 domain-containing protein [Luteimonas gilva]